MSTLPANYEQAEAGICGTYRAANHKEPDILLRSPSPLSAIYHACIAEAWIEHVPGATTGDARAYETLQAVCLQIEEQAPEDIKARVNFRGENSLLGTLLEQVKAKLFCDHCYLAKKRKIKYNKGTKEHDKVTDVCETIYKKVKDWRNCFRGGNLWSSWYSYVSFLRDHCDWKDPILEKYAWDEMYATAAGWCIYLRRVAAVSDRPLLLLRNETNEMHADKGPCLKYRDGYRLYMLSGVKVDQQIVERPQTQTLTQIRNEKNVEVKRIRAERYGYKKYLTEIGAKVVNERINVIEATKEALMRTPDGMVFLVCACPSTNRVYTMEVNPEIETCEGAQNYLSNGLSKKVIGAT
jgi:hypothetical protein